MLGFSVTVRFAMESLEIMSDPVICTLNALCLRF